MSPLRLLKFGLIAVMACVVGGAVYVSTLVRERQEMLGKIARYNTSWLAGQALGEFMRFEARVAQYGVPGAGLDKDEVHLRFDILVNRFDLLMQGDVRQFIDSSPEHRETVAQIRDAIRTIEPLIDRLDEPGIVNRVLNLLSPFDSRLVGLASAANRFGGDRVSTDQRELMELHWAFSGFVAALLAGGMGLIVLLLWHNKALTRTGRELDESTRRISAQSDEIALVNEALEIRNGRFDAALRNMSQGLCLVSRDARLVVCNQRFLQLFGIPEGAATPGTPVLALVEAAVLARALSETQLREIFGRQRSLGFTANAGNFDSEDVDGRTVAITQRPMEDGGWIATYEDVTDRRRAESQIAYMAHHDALTGLANRVLFREHLEQAALRARRSGDKVVVLYLDLDQFKDVNDTLGHPIGDLLLKAVAERLRLCVHESDFVARLGGDEFAILHCVHGGAHDSSALATRIVEQLGQPFDIDGHQVNIGTSIGIAIAAGDETPDQLLKNADMALYKAKSDGRRTFRYFEPAMDEALQARRALELDLRKALATDELELYYQPIVGLKAGTISGFEALMRWRHPERGFVPPSEFVPIAEETGLIVALGAWTLRQACSQAASWPSHIKIAVNLSPIQFKTRGLVETITVALGASGVAPSRLELEITESVLLQENDSTLATLHQIRALGVRIAMDDFGTGYSSLSYLRSFPFDKIKVDRCFVEELSEQSNSAAIIRSVVELGATLGMTTTAEGIETPEQLRLLREAGCDEGQGYLLARPMPFPQTLDTLAKENGIAHAA